MPADFDIRRIEVIDDLTAEIYRRMTPGRRLRIGFDTWESAKAWTQAGIRHRHPEWTEVQVREEFIRRMNSATG